jgi:acylphosphatase
MARIKVTVYGIVQGVGFRHHTRQTAIQLGLTGYVMNKPDGTVEIVADGSPETLQRLIDWAHHGPATARVDRVAVEDQLAVNRFEHFNIEYSA